MTTKLLGAKDVLTKEGWLLSETSREGSPYDWQFLINHKEYFPLSGSFRFCQWYLSSPITECIHNWSLVLDWVMGVVVKVGLFFGMFPFQHNCISPYTLVVVESRKPALFFNLLNKLYVWVDRVQMVRKLYHVDFR